MCGIISYFSQESTYTRKMENLIRDLLFVDTIRGYHSTGLIYESSFGEVEFYKKAVGAPDFLQMDIPSAIIAKHDRTRYIIGHNRAATLGKVDSNNAHPFQCGELTGVHNGTLANHRNIGGGYHEVDSHCLYQAMNDHGIAPTITKAQGDYALAWHDAADDSIHFLRNIGRPYCFAKLKGLNTIVGASEKGMLKWLVQRNGFQIEFCWTPQEMTEYTWDLAGDLTKPTKAKHTEWKPALLPAPQKAATPLVIVGGTDDSISVSGGSAGPQTIEFKLDTTSWSGKDDGMLSSYFGYDMDENEVAIHNCHADEFEVGTWYTGRGYWLGASVGKPYWRVNPMSVKLHEAEIQRRRDDAASAFNSEDSMFHICIQCHADFQEHEVLWVDNAPCCLDCCISLNVQDDQIDPGQENKLNAH